MSKSDYDIVEICQLKSDSIWRNVANPTEADLKQAEYWLSNAFCEYLEYSTEVGTVSRYIRRKDLRKYIPAKAGGEGAE